MAILIAFVLGFGARLIGLPPLIGFLAGGFILHALRLDGGELLAVLGEYGVYLLLFSIGLKLRPSSLLRPEVWGVASVQMGLLWLAQCSSLRSIHCFGGSPNCWYSSLVNWVNSIGRRNTLKVGSCHSAIKTACSTNWRSWRALIDQLTTRPE